MDVTLDDSPAHPDDDQSPIGGDDPGAPDGDPPGDWQDMAPLFAAHCTGCHQPGGIAPFALDDYAMAKAYAPSIRTATASRAMPPWGVTSDGTCGE